MDPQHASGPVALTGPIELLRSSWRLFQANWKLLASIALIPLLASAVGRVFAISSQPLAAALGGFLVLAGWIVMIAMQIAIVDAVHKVSVGQADQISVRGQYRLSLQSFWPLIGVMVLRVPVMIGALAAFIVPAVALSVYTSFYVLALIVDGKRGWSAFAESYALVKGRWWRTLGRLAALALAMAAIYLIAAGLSFLAQSLFGVSIHSAGADSITAVLNDLISIVAWPLAVVYIYRLYQSLKASRQADVATKAFRRWLIAFLVVGIAVPFILVPIMAWIAFSSLDSARQSARDALSRVEQVRQAAQEQGNAQY